LLKARLASLLTVPELLNETWLGPEMESQMGLQYGLAKMELSALTGIALSGGFEFYIGCHTRLLDILLILNDASGVDLVTAVTPVPRSIKKADLSCFLTKMVPQAYRKQFRMSQEKYIHSQDNTSLFVLALDLLLIILVRRPVNLPLTLQLYCGSMDCCFG
jgi:hypothetical protein